MTLELTATETPPPAPARARHGFTPEQVVEFHKTRQKYVEQMHRQIGAVIEASQRLSEKDLAITINTE